jgi:predicted enzyme related to lactoylglutathione lyase
MSLPNGLGPERQRMTPSAPNPVVHLELHTANLPCACAFFTRLFGWEVERVHTESGDYSALSLGDRLEGGIVEHETGQPFWLPYVEVADVPQVTDQSRQLGAEVLLPPREGPAGWRSILAVPAVGEIALWQPKS